MNILFRARSQAHYIQAIFYLKALATYNMVFIHGYYILLMANPSLHTYTKLTHYTLMFRGFFALCLPAFAGYFFRHRIGPYFQNGKLSSGFLKFGIRFFPLAVLAEAIRLAFWGLNLSSIFYWNALHFISLSIFICCLVLSLHQRLLLPFTIVVIFLRARLAFISDGHSFTAAAPPHFSIVAWCWSICFGGLLGFTVLLLWGHAKCFSQSRKKLNLFLFLLPAAAGVFWAYPYIMRHPLSLITFSNLPISIWVTNPTDYNFWPFFSFFPVFVFGYYLREIFFFHSPRFILVATCVASLLALKFLIFDLHAYAALTSAREIYTKGLFQIGFILLSGILAIFFLSIIVLTKFLGRLDGIWIRRWAKLSDNTIAIYIIHTLFFSLLAHYGNLSARSWLKTDFFLGGIFLYGIVHLVYALTLLVAGVGTRIGKRFREA